MSTTYDVVIVGGRVAGASTAMLLARAGLRVAVLERSGYGTDTLSTHGLMRAGVLQLSRWGVLPAVVAAGTPAVRRTLFHYADGETVHVSIRPSPGVDALYAPRRHLVDRILVDAAADAGAVVRHGVTVTGLLQDAHGRVSGVRAVGPDGRTIPLRARFTVGADGFRSVVANTVGAPIEKRAAAGASVLYRYHADLAVAGYEWAYGDAAAAGMIPTNGEVTCVFVSTTPARMRALRRGGAEAAYENLLRAAAPHQLSRLHESSARGRLRGWAGAPGVVRRAWGSGWALVGDAGYYKDPITAHGMTDALRDAELLADALVTASGGVGQEAEALAGYQSQRDRLSSRLFGATDRIAAYEWDLPGAHQLLREVSSAMSDEVDVLQVRPPWQRRTGGRSVMTG